MWGGRRPGPCVGCPRLFGTWAGPLRTGPGPGWRQVVIGGSGVGVVLAQGLQPDVQRLLLQGLGRAYWPWAFGLQARLL